MAKDTYFLDRDKALRIARQQDMTTLDSGEKVVRICYYDGKPFKTQLENLINVPAGNFAQYFSKNIKRLPTKIDCAQKGIPGRTRAEIQAQFQQLIDSIKKNHVEEKQAEIKDAYFFDRAKAYETAIQKNSVKFDWTSVPGLQICYHDGEPFDDPPENLVHVPVENLFEFFTNTRNRYPEEIFFPDEVTPDNRQKISHDFKTIMDETVKQREKIAESYQELCRNLKPDLKKGGPYRIFIFTSIYTEVMQYALKNIAQAFESLGHQAMVSIESSRMEIKRLDGTLMDYRKFRPDITVNLNHLNNGWLHPEVFNFTWWQDPMDKLLAGEKWAWRKRDYPFSITPHLAELLKKTAAPEVRLQPFCIDRNIFHSAGRLPRKRKVVFIGSSYYRKFYAAKNVPQDFFRLIEEIVARINTGQLYDVDFANKLRKKYAHLGEDTSSLAHNYASRDTMVRWLCQAPDIEVEVYGRGWELDDVVSPSYKGELPHGRAVAEVYQTAQYALECSLQHNHIDHRTQRFLEIAACGCTPVVYDMRATAPEDSPVYIPPDFLDDKCLFFRTPDQMYDCFTKTPKKPPETLVQGFTYEDFARQMLKMVDEDLEKGATT